MTRLVAHVTKSPNYNGLQSAYRRGHSTEKALLKLLNDVYCAANNGFRTMLLQLDQSDAFDTMTSALFSDVYDSLSEFPVQR